jgi:AcrR family transcriptional regulator
MSVSTRKQREREEMRSLILDAARKIFLDKGYTQTSIRNIAEAIEYSPGTIYLYFKEKDEIFHALHEEGFRRFLDKMEPLKHVAEPFERLKAIGLAYLDFARNNKDFYDLMFIMEAPMTQDPENQWEMGNQALQFLKNVLRECQETGRFAGKDINYLSFMIWSLVHGMCALFCRQRCQAYSEENLEPEDLMKHGYSYFVEMLNKI